MFKVGSSFHRLSGTDLGLCPSSLRALTIFKPPPLPPDIRISSLHRQLGRSVLVYYLSFQLRFSIRLVVYTLFLISMENLNASVFLFKTKMQVPSINTVLHQVLLRTESIKFLHKIDKELYLILKEKKYQVITNIRWVLTGK